jgi:hypothetical protein
MEVSMTTITVDLAPDQLYQLKAQAARLGLTPEELARVTIEEALAQPEKASPVSGQSLIPATAGTKRVIRETIDFWKGATVAELAKMQGARPVRSLDDLWGNFWPENESVDAFIASIRQWRRRDAQA